MKFKIILYLFCIFFLTSGCVRNQNELKGYTLNDVETAIKESKIDNVEESFIKDRIIIKQNDSERGTLEILVSKTKEEMDLVQRKIKEIKKNEVSQKGVVTQFEQYKNIIFVYKVPSTTSEIVSKIKDKLRDDELSVETYHGSGGAWDVAKHQ